MDWTWTWAWAAVSRECWTDAYGGAAYAAGWVYGDLCLVPVRSTIIGRPRSDHCAVRWAYMSDGPMGGVHVRMSGWQESGCRTWTCNGTGGKFSRNARRDTVNLREAETHRSTFITVAV